jgi:hypothetical protein
LAAAVRDPANLPDGMSPGLDADAWNDCDVFTFPNGCHVAEVEIDPQTGAVTPRFCGIELHPAGGSSAGLLTDVHARVIHQRRRPILGLYASPARLDLAIANKPPTHDRIPHAKTPRQVAARRSRAVQAVR